MLELSLHAGPSTKRRGHWWVMQDFSLSILALNLLLSIPTREISASWEAPALILGRSPSLHFLPFKSSEWAKLQSKSLKMITKKTHNECRWGIWFLSRWRDWKSNWNKGYWRIKVWRWLGAIEMVVTICLTFPTVLPSLLIMPSFTLNSVPVWTIHSMVIVKEMWSRM